MLRLTSLLLLGPATVFASIDEPPGYSYTLTGEPADLEPATEGALFLVGGAMSSGDKSTMELAMRWFASKSGGGNLLLLGASAAPSRVPSPTARWFADLAAFSSIEWVDFYGRGAASDPCVLGLIARAEGIFILGGDQSEYIKYWKDTPVATALNAHLVAGKPLGGTSAGLAVLGEFYYSAMLKSVTSEQTLKNPFDANVTLDTGFLSAPTLAGVITDTHFMERKRLGRLISFLARLQTEHPTAPRLVGIGVDEGTALCVEADATARVVSNKTGSAWLVQLLASPAAVVVDGRPLAARASVIGLGPDSTVNLRTLELGAPVTVRTVSAEELLTP